MSLEVKTLLLIIATSGFAFCESFRGLEKFDESRYPEWTYIFSGQGLESLTDTQKAKICDIYANSMSASKKGHEKEAEFYEAAIGLIGKMKYQVWPILQNRNIDDAKLYIDTGYPVKISTNYDIKLVNGNNSGFPRFVLVKQKFSDYFPESIIDNQGNVVDVSNVIWFVK